MEFKNYKVWRFAYVNHTEDIKLPANLKLWCSNKTRKEDETFKGPNDMPVWNEHWVGVVRYSEELDEFLKTDNALSYTAYILNDQFIVFDFEQIFPLSEDWPETEEAPDISNTYIKYICTDAKIDIDILNIESKRINALNVSDAEKEELIEREFCPVTQYIKIHGFKNECVDVTAVITYSWDDGSPTFMVIREMRSISSVFSRNYFEAIRKSNASEYNTALNELLLKI